MDPSEISSSRKRVTLRDIANATGVHYTTVGLALRDSPVLRAETRKKIQDAAARLGYAPDPMLFALNAYRIGSHAPKFQAVIAWINNWPNPDDLRRNGTFRQFYEGACARARQLGYLVEEFWVRKRGMTPEKLEAIFKARNIQALLIAPQPHAHVDLKIDFQKFIAVALGYSMRPAILNVVSNHQFQSMNLAISELMNLGYRRPGLWLEADWDERVNNAWVGGYLTAHWIHSKKLEFIPPCLGSPDADIEKWIQEQQPDVVVSVNEVAERLEELGYKIPQQFGFVSLDLNVEGGHLSGIDQNSSLIGQKAVDVLVAMIHRGERCIPEIPMRTLVESVWVPGQTLLKQRRNGKRASA